MLIQMKEISPVERYRMMIQTLIPRPVAWTLTENESGNYNLAPFSYFNAVHSHPPLLMMSIGYKRDKSKKDTRRNIERTKEFIVHIGSATEAKEMTQSSLALDYGISEVEDSRLELIEDSFKTIKLPRLQVAKVAFACKLERVLEVGHNNQGVVFGEIIESFIADDIIDTNSPDLRVEAMKLNPIARLGGDDYGELGKSFTIERPSYTPH